MTLTILDIVGIELLQECFTIVIYSGKYSADSHMAIGHSGTVSRELLTAHGNNKKKHKK